MTTVGVLVATVSALVGYLFSELRHRREIGVKIIEIAVGILAGEPDKNEGLRKWAVDALARYAEKAKVPLSEDAQNALREKALPVLVFGTGTGTARAGSSAQAKSAISD